MCFWPFVCYVHAVNTTEKHAKQRKKHKYSKRCSQCFKKLDNDDHVSAHVVAYPCYCLNCFIGMLTLKTTCKKCNNRNRVGKKYINNNSWFCIKTLCTGEYKIGKKIQIIFWPICIPKSL